MANYGCPEIITTDRGRQFTSNRWRSTLLLLGIKAKRITASCLQANGIVERFHRHLKTVLNARRGDWSAELPLILMSLRTTTREDTGATPAALRFYRTFARRHDYERPCPHEPDKYVHSIRAAMEVLANFRLNRTIVEMLTCSLRLRPPSSFS